jgi:NADPH-dependent 7-cyano-7-deazaguanine reductase QueF-like protein
MMAAYLFSWLKMKGLGFVTIKAFNVDFNAS